MLAMEELGTCPQTSWSLSSALSSSRPHPLVLRPTQALTWPWLGGASGQSWVRLACTTAEGPSVGLRCIHQHPGECKHSILAPFGRVTGRRRLVPQRLDCAELGSP